MYVIGKTLLADKNINETILHLKQLYFTLNIAFDILHVFPIHMLKYQSHE